MFYYTADLACDLVDVQFYDAPGDNSIPAYYMVDMDIELHLTPDVPPYEQSYQCKVRAKLVEFEHDFTFKPDNDPLLIIRDWCKGLIYTDQYLTLTPDNSVREYDATGSLRILKHVMSRVTYIDLKYVNFQLYNPDPSIYPLQ